MKQTTDSSAQEILDKLEGILDSRKSAQADSSYVASLYQKGLDSILKKIGEEATETVMAAKDGEREKIIYEVADLWFHVIVMLRQQNISSHEVLLELERRFGLSGIEEKASRN